MLTHTEREVDAPVDTGEDGGVQEYNVKQKKEASEMLSGLTKNTTCPAFTGEWLLFFK